LVYLLTIGGFIPLPLNLQGREDLAGLLYTNCNNV